mmetsp:Transcript_27321/g.49142  ORF Transcript_27321/g.49142 Transcript_27321/m.49142 type:complete len:94 (-) Transcript_27321:1002-1283(-)
MSCFSLCFHSRRRRSSGLVSPSRTESFLTDDNLESKLEAIKMKHRMATMQLPKMKPVQRDKSKTQEYEELPIYKLTDGQYVASGSSQRVYFHQ